MEPTQAKTTSRIQQVGVAILFALAVICYLNTLGNGFVYDDELQILQNPYVKSWQYLPAIFRTTVWSFIGAAGETNYYRPLMTITYLGLWKTFGDLPMGFHLFNILVNALVVTCVYYAGQELFKDHLVALLAAILFAVHPVHTETVSWVAAVPDLEGTFFFLTGFYLYAKRSGVGWKRQALVVVCLLLGLTAKEPVLMLVPLLIYYEHFVREGCRETPLAAKVKRYLPVCIGGAGYLLLRIALFGKLAPVLQHAQISWAQAAYSGLALVTEYTKLLFWPAHLSAFHVFHASHSIHERPVLAGAGILAVSVVLMLLLQRRWPAAAFCIVWTAITLLPVLNARWMAANVLTERYLYLPSVGFCWLAVWAGKQVWCFVDTRLGQRPIWRPILAAPLFLMASLGAAKTWARNAVWHDDMTLYTTTLRTDPDAYVMHLNLGTSFFATGDFNVAEKEFRRALELRPNSPNVLNALGCLYLEQGRLEESAGALQNAVALQPLWSDPHFNYGRLLQKIGQRDAALTEFRTAIVLGPLNATARLYLARELAERGNLTQAEAEYRKSLELSASLAAQQGLADILLKTGREEAAATALRQLARDYPYDSTTHRELGNLWEKRGMPEEARQEYQRTLQIDPANVEAHAGVKRLDKLAEK